MIVCTKCGFHNTAADSFCGSCGSFLEWTGSKVAEPAPELDAPKPEPQPAEPEHQTFVGRVREAVGMSGGSASAGAADGEPAGGTPESAAPVVADSGGAASVTPEGQVAAAPALAPVVVTGARIYRMAEPEPGPAADPEPAPAPEPEPAPALEPEPVAVPEPEAAAPPEPPEPAPAPEPEPAAPPEPPEPPEPQPAPPPEPMAVPEPELAAPPEPAPAPEPEPAVPPEPPEPSEPQPAPPPELAAPPEPPEPEPQPEPEPAPAPVPLPPVPAPPPPVPALVPPAPPRIRPALGGPAGTTPRPRPLVEIARPASPAISATPSAVEPPPAIPADQPPAARPSVPSAQPPAARPTRAAAPPTISATPPAQPAAVLPAPPPDQPASRQPIAVRPGPEHARQAARQAQADTPPANPGDLICGNCRIGNDPTRKFCRRCGQSLAEAVVAVAPKLPWYRRIFRRQRRAAVAGERPKSMRTDGRGSQSGLSVGRLLRVVFQILVVAALVGAVVGYSVVPGWRDGVNSIFSSIRQVVAPNLVPVRTAGQATGSAVKGHPAQAAFDGFSNTYWAAPATGGASPTISAGFSPATDVAKILVTSGAVPDFQGSPRPHDISVQLLDATGAVVAAKDLELKDVKDPQSFDVSAKGATTFRLTVNSVYASSGGTNVAITEVEFLAAK